MSDFQVQKRWDVGLQRVLNAREVPPLHRQTDLVPVVPVCVRVVWELDGEEFIDSVAYAFCGRDVLVELPGIRTNTVGTWFDVADAPKR